MGPEAPEPAQERLPPQEALGWLHEKLIKIIESLGAEDARRKKLDYLIQNFDKVVICVFRTLCQEKKSPSIKIGINEDNETGEQGFALTLTKKEAEKLHEEIPEDHFNDLCLYGIETMLNEYERQNNPEYARRDIRKLEKLKTEFETLPPDDPKRKEYIKFFASI
ncbi:hypothetical protein ACFL10_00300 [Patescibacteria group bacterium]